MAITNIRSGERIKVHSRGVTLVELTAAVAAEALIRDDDDTAEAATRAAADTAEGNARAAADTAEGNARAAADTALDGRLDTVEVALPAFTGEIDQVRLGIRTEHRPGLRPDLFTASVAGGAPEALDPLDQAMVVATTEGPAVRMVGGETGRVVMREAIPIEPGRIYRAHGYGFMSADPVEDEAGDSVEARINWYASDLSALSGFSAWTRAAIVSPLWVADGPFFFDVTISRTLAANITPPDDARFAKLEFNRSGIDGAYDAIWLKIEDATAAAATVVTGEGEPVVTLDGAQTIVGPKEFTQPVVVADPVSDGDAVNKGWLDDVAASSALSVTWHTEVRVATTVDGTFATAFDNGSIVDGVTILTGNRILIKNQTAGAENGIYVVQVSGAPVRATDADTEAEILKAGVLVSEGTSNVGTAWVMNTAAPITLGTTAITFAALSRLVLASNAETIAGVLTNKAVPPAADKAALDARVGPIETQLADVLTSKLASLGAGQWDLDLGNHKVVVTPGAFAQAVRKDTIGSSGEYFYGIDRVRFREPHAPEKKEGRNRAWTEGRLRKGRGDLAYPIEGYNGGGEYMQSNAGGISGSPPKSKIAFDTNLMLGTSVFSNLGSDWAPMGGTLALNPLIAKVLSGGVIKTDAEIADAGFNHSAARGEPFGVAATNVLRALMNRHLMVDTDPDHLLTYNNFGITARSMAELQEGHTQGATEFFNVIKNYLAPASLNGWPAAIEAASPGAKRQMLYWILCGLEQEYGQAALSTAHTRADIKTQLSLFIDQITTHSLGASNLTNKRPPGFYFVMSGEGYTRDVDKWSDPDLMGAMAVIELAIERKLIAALPYAPLDDWGSQHRKTNGYRQGGAKLGQIIFHTQMLGRDWFPVFPIETEVRGKFVWVHFNVPVPPLRFGNGLKEGAIYHPPTHSFRVSDATGNVATVASNPVQIMTPTIVRIECLRKPLPSALLWHGNKTDDNGHIDLCDSDYLANGLPTFTDPYTGLPGSLDMWNYQAGSGDTADQNQSLLNGLPYDMSNYCWPFVVPADGWSLVNA